MEEQVERLEAFIREKQELRTTHPQRYLFWETTLRCNMQCLHCRSDCVRDNSTRSNELSVDQVMAELASIAHVYPPETITLAMIGGAPLLRKEDVCQVGAYAAQLGYHWGIVTNAMLLDKATIRQLEHAGLETLSVSLGGIPVRIHF